MMIHLLRRYLTWDTVPWDTVPWDTVKRISRCSWEVVLGGSWNMSVFSWWQRNNFSSSASVHLPSDIFWKMETLFKASREWKDKGEDGKYSMASESCIWRRQQERPEDVVRLWAQVLHWAVGGGVWNVLPWDPSNLTGSGQRISLFLQKQDSSILKQWLRT